MNLDPAAPAGIPPAVQAVVRRAMAKDPAQRYPDAAAMARDMETALTRPASAISYPSVAAPPAISQPQRPPSHSQQPADPFALLQPDDLALQQPGYPQTAYGYRRSRRGPLLSPMVRAWFGALLLSIVAAGLVLLGIWGTMRAWESYQSNASRQAAMAQFAQARKAFDAGDFDAATRGFYQAMKMSPGSDVGRVARHNAVNSALSAGAQRQKRHDVAGAQAAYMEALRIDPESASAYSELGSLLFNSAQWNQAFAYWDRALQLWQQQVRQGRLDADEVRAAHEGVARTEQNYANALVRQGDQLKSQQRMSEAVQVWQRALQIGAGSSAAVAAQDRLNQFGGFGTGGGEIFPNSSRIFP
jgi:tetratricopeptide (TPR) repeat protein